MPVIERIPIFDKTTKKNAPSQTIVVHFAILRQKQQFYSLYLSKMPLEPTKFGLENMSRIVIGENLTVTNAKIFKQALTMKKNKKIAQAYTENGIVKIKIVKGKNETAHIVRSITSLETITMQNQQGMPPAIGTNAAASSTNNNNNSNTNDKAQPTPATTAPVDNNNSKDNDTPKPMDVVGNNDGSS